MLFNSAISINMRFWEGKLTNIYTRPFLLRIQHIILTHLIQSSIINIQNYRHLLLKLSLIIWRKTCTYIYSHLCHTLWTNRDKYMFVQVFRQQNLIGKNNWNYNKTPQPHQHRDCIVTIRSLNVLTKIMYSIYCTNRYTFLA